MATVNVTATPETIIYGTHAHGEERLADPDTTTPSMLRWSAFHPGLKVLPKGSAAAGSGEINWEDTLGGKLAFAAEQLEGLLYAMFGSRPAAYDDLADGWDVCQWYNRLHPRCLWGPETWQRDEVTGTAYCDAVPGNCWDYKATGKEYAALGEHPPCCPMPTPSVPIRSRSGDPLAQYARDHTRDATVFPAGSVTRTQSDSPHDPEGFGWFGATNPGRNDAASNPWLTEANGYTWKDGDAVTFSWTKPDGLATPTSVKLYYRTRPPGGTWDIDWSTATMTGGPEYSADLGPYVHGTEIQWAVRVDVAGGTHYAPGGDSPPAAPYTLACFTHFNPYDTGLPEMLEDYGGVDVRHGTDYYQFDGAETIQPELLNMMRWVLSWLGGDCCTGDYDTCAETDLRADVCHFNPRTRGGGDGICCIPMPIKFRWSGSNVYPHYQAGGKASDSDPAPLHNREADTGDSASRLTWRGINMLFVSEYGNREYGGGTSWGTAPGTFILDWDGVSASSDVYAKYPSWGLRDGDVIEAVHVQEIIDAVAYLIDNGVWTTAPVYSTPMTPGTYVGIDCGTMTETVVTNEPGYPDTLEWTITYCDKCCKPSPSCQGVWWRYYEDDVLEDETETDTPFTCDPYTAPTWSACWTAGSNDFCGMKAEREIAANCVAGAGGTPETSAKTSFTSVRCDTGSRGTCGEVMSERTCMLYGTGAGVYGRHVTEEVEGWSAYICTPPACFTGWDTSHGNGNQYMKRRYDHVWHPGLQEIDTGPNTGESAGNCFGDMFACGDTFPTDEEDTGAWFGEVTGVRFNGLVSDLWWEYKDPSPSCDCWDLDAAYGLYPDVPGLGQHTAAGVAICEQYHYDEAYNYRNAKVACACNVTSPVCDGEAVWVAVDLDLDGDGHPYRSFTGRNDDGAAYTGRGVPFLADYSLEEDPDTWPHDCPCETWTGLSECEVGHV